MPLLNDRQRLSLHEPPKGFDPAERLREIAAEMARVDGLSPEDFVPWEPVPAVPLPDERTWWEWFRDEWFAPLLIIAGVAVAAWAMWSLFQLRDV